MNKYIVKKYSQAEITDMAKGFFAGTSLADVKVSFKDTTPGVRILLNNDSDIKAVSTLLGAGFVAKKYNIDTKVLEFHLHESGEMMSSFGLTNVQLSMDGKEVITSLLPFKFDEFWNEIEDLIPAIEEDNGIAALLLNNIKKYIM